MNFVKKDIPIRQRKKQNFEPNKIEKWAMKSSEDIILSKRLGLLFETKIANNMLDQPKPQILNAKK